MKTLAQIAKYIPLIHPKSITATETSTGINIEGYNDDALGIVDFGAIGGTTETHDVVFQVSDDSTNGSDGVWTTVTTIGQITGSNGNNKVAAGRVNLAGHKWVRAVDTMSSTTASLICVGILVTPMTQNASVNSLTPATVTS